MRTGDRMQSLKFQLTSTMTLGIQYELPNATNTRYAKKTCTMKLTSAVVSALKALEIA